MFEVSLKMGKTIDSYGKFVFDEFRDHPKLDEIVDRADALYSLMPSLRENVCSPNYHVDYKKKVDSLLYLLRCRYK